MRPLGSLCHQCMLASSSWVVHSLQHWQGESMAVVAHGTITALLEHLRSVASAAGLMELPAAVCISGQATVRACCMPACNQD